MSTIHIGAKHGEIASTVLMPGDPLRAKFLAEKYLTNAKEVSSVRNILAYTGKYQGKEVTVMASGMGMPSMAIYSHELFNHYDVQKIIRIGTCGALKKEIHIKDIIIAQGACTDSNFAYQFQLNGTISALSSYSLLEKAVEKAKQLKVNYHVGNIFTSDLFYTQDSMLNEKWASVGCLAVEMESYALFLNATYFHREAITLLTVSDHLILDEHTTSFEREQTFTEMMEIALEMI